MIYPLVDFNEWAKKYDLKIKTKKCENRKCGKTISTTIPFVNKHGFGLCSPICSCGKGGGLTTICLRNGIYTEIKNVMGMYE